MSYTLSRYSMFQNYCRFDCSCDKLKNATYVLKILQTTKGSLRKATFCRPTRVPALPEAFAKFLYVNFGAAMGRGGGTDRGTVHTSLSRGSGYESRPNAPCWQQCCARVYAYSTYILYSTIYYYYSIISRFYCARV